MTRDSLIDRLTEDLKPVRRRRLGVDLSIVGVICAIEIALFFAMGAARPDMKTMMMHQPSVWWRLASLGLIALISCSLAVLSFNPVYSPRRTMRWVVLIAVICLGVGLFVGAGPAAQLGIADRLNWHAGMRCTYKMVLLSLPPVIGLAFLMRRGAPTEPRRTALLAGLAAACWGAFVFVFACPSNDPLYIGLWYSVGCGIVTVLSRIFLPLLSRW